MSPATSFEMYEYLRSKRRARLAGRVALWVSAALCAVILIGVGAVATLGWLDAGSAPVAGVMDAEL